MNGPSMTMTNLGGMVKENDTGVFTNAPVRNINTDTHYYWMTNKKGRVVPISRINLNWALSKGFLHTDNVLHFDDPKDQVHAEVVSPAEQMAKAAQQMADVAKSVVSDESKEVVKRGRKKKEEIVEV